MTTPYEPSQSPSHPAGRPNLCAAPKFFVPVLCVAMACSAVSAYAQVFNSPLELSDLVSGDGTQGFAINGVTARDRSGHSVSAAGDFNGDGIDDVIIGNHRGSYRQGQRFRSQAGYVVFGSNAPPQAALELSDLDGTNGFAMDTDNLEFATSVNVSGAGDVNGDGLDDVMVSTGSTISGGVHVVFGSDQAFPSQIQLPALNGRTGFTINSGDSGFLHSVSAAGDVNGDGIDDIIIGAPLGGARTYGTSYVLFGSNQGFPATLDITEVDGTNGFVINGIMRTAYSGGSVSAAGDVNADGIDDVIIGAKFAYPNGANSGASFVVFGSRQGFPAAISVADLDGNNGFIMNGAFEDGQAGISVSGTGDVNGDNIDDMIIGASVNSGNRPGFAYVVFGSNQGFAATMELAALDGTDGFLMIGPAAEDYVGEVVSGAGDVDNDGLNDLLIGAPNSNRSNNYPGAGFVVFGSAQPYPAKLALSSLDGVQGFRINGAGEYHFAGRGISAAGDINGDGVDDIIIGARSANPGGRSAAGASYVVYGRSRPGDSDVRLSIEDARITEGDSSANIKLQLNQASRNEITATVYSRPESAINGEDYYGFTDTVRFAPGILTVEFALTIIDDTRSESNESFEVRLTDANGAVLVDDVARVTIIDNDSEPAPPRVSVLDGRVAEGDQHSIALALSRATDSEVTVKLYTLPDTAVNGRDYYGVYTVVRFPAGETSAKVSVQTLPDAEIEPEESFLVQIADPQGAELGDSAASVTIIETR